MEPTIELWACPPLRARLTESACGANAQQARRNASKGGYNPLEPCLDCPGVRALAAGGGPSEHLDRRAEKPEEPLAARRRPHRRRIKPGVNSHLRTERRPPPRAPDEGTVSRAEIPTSAITIAEMVKRAGHTDQAIRYRLKKHEIAPLYPAAHGKAALYPRAACEGKVLGNGAAPEPVESPPPKSKPEAAPGRATDALGEALARLREDLRSREDAIAALQQELDAAHAGCADVEQAIAALEKVCA